MAKFKDKLSGFVTEFTLEHDIEAMRRHPEYDEVKDEEVKEEPKKPELKAPAKTLKS